MKEKIIIFLVGLLLGSIISTGAIYFYTIAENNNSKGQIQNNDFGNGGERGPGDGMNNPPEVPNNNQGQQSN